MNRGETKKHWTCEIIKLVEVKRKNDTTLKQLKLDEIIK